MDPVNPLNGPSITLTSSPTTKGEINDSSPLFSSSNFPKILLISASLKGIGTLDAPVPEPKNPITPGPFFITC